MCFRSQRRRLRGGLERAHRRPFFPLLLAPRLARLEPARRGTRARGPTPRARGPTPRARDPTPRARGPTPRERDHGLASARRGLALGRRSQRAPSSPSPARAHSPRDAARSRAPGLAFLRNLIRRLLPRAPRILRAQRLLVRAQRLLVRIQRLATRLHLRGRRQRLVALRLEADRPLRGLGARRRGDPPRRGDARARRRREAPNAPEQTPCASRRDRIRAERRARSTRRGRRRRARATSKPALALAGRVSRLRPSRRAGWCRRAGGDGEGRRRGRERRVWGASCVVSGRRGSASRRARGRETRPCRAPDSARVTTRALANALVFDRTVVADGERARGGVYGRARVGVARG